MASVGPACSRRKRLTGFVLLCLLALPGTAAAATGDTIADRVLGQANLRSVAPYFVDGRVFGAGGIAFDRSAVPNRVYVADTELNRVLGWSDERGFLRGSPADLVLGQPDLATGEFFGNSGFPGCRRASATTFCTPEGIAVDGRGNLYVVDSRNSRVLEFDRPFERDARADRVFGQPDFATVLNDPEGGLGFPEIALDPAGRLFILERVGQQRLLVYESPLARGARPVLVSQGAGGEACFARSEAGRFCAPLGLAADARGDLYVLDVNFFSVAPSSFHVGRILVYRGPLESGEAPALELSFDTGPVPAQGGLVVDAAGDLLFSAGTCIARVAAPITAGSAPECAIARPDFPPLARLAVDADGSLFAAQFYAPGDLFSNMLLKYEPPFRTARLPQVVTSPRLTPRSLRLPVALAIDASVTPNRLYAMDLYHRVLGWRDAEGFASGAPADLVIGARGRRPPEAKGLCAGPAADRLCGSYTRAAGLAVDPGGNLYVADSSNNRVLEFERPFETDAVADRVIGQGRSFTSSDCNKGGLSAASLCLPGALAVDRRGNLYVADLANARVLFYQNPRRSDAVADRLFGQSDFTRRDPGENPAVTHFVLGDLNINHGGIQEAAAGLAVDRRGNLYVGDGGQNRVFIFADAARSDALADHVIGGGAGEVSARSLLLSSGIALGTRGELYVADTYRARVLEFDNPLRDGVADRVFGQKDFTSGGSQAVRPTAANLQLPTAVAVDQAGNLYVADTGHFRVVAYDQP